MHIGIDYGSKLAGTTVICFHLEGQLKFLQSEKKHNADLLIKNFVKEYHPSKIFLDAPLSLPSAFYGNGNDFFYRECDRKLKAMSPMFLGGLTARAVKLKHELAQNGIEFFESYPKALANFLGLNEIGYKKDKIPCDLIIDTVLTNFNLTLEAKPSNWHQFDSLLVWIIGYRFSSNEVQKIGDENEGLIYF